MKRKISVLLAFVILFTGCFGNFVMTSEAAGNEKSGNQDKVVVALDPGHDSKHGGASANGLREHIVTLKIANYCRQKLESHGGIEVYMTRTQETCPYPFTTSAKCIDQRALAAAAANASLFVSFHLNAETEGTTAKGVEVIYPNSNWKPKVGADGKRLAEKVHDKLVGIGLNDRGIYSRNSTINERYPDGSLSDYYNVQISNKESGIPGIIIEHAFITNLSDVLKFLQTEAGLKKLGEAVADGIITYLNGQNGWEYTNGNWYYYKNGVRATGWHLINSKWYYMNKDGVMQTGWCKVDGTWYYMNSSGAMQTGWQHIGGVWYYMNSSGAMQTGFQQIDGTWYYMNSSGAMQTGWQSVNGAKYYFDSSGAMKIGWQIVDGERYLFDGKGKVVDGAKYFIIDVSQWQGTVNWDEVARTDVDGVIVRCSHGDELTEEGDSWKDKKFAENIAALNEKGIPYGIYHYNTATTVEQARQQAKNMIRLMESANAVPMLPVFADIESEAENCDLVAIAKVYMDEIIANGYLPGIYANTYYWSNFLNDPTLNAYYKWIADYGSAENLQNGTANPAFSPKDGIENYMMWQYTSNGVLQGITENTVDCNVMYKWHEKANGWKQINNKWFYYSSGRLADGWKRINGYWYYFSDGGVMQTGWRKVDDTWYYMDSSGAMQTGWCKVNDIWYFMNGGGAMQTGWRQVNGTWYYMDSSGAMQTGWCKIDDTWYYMNDSGAMQTGWQKIGGYWYYMKSSGAMVTGDVVINGVTNHFNSSGVWLG